MRSLTFTILALAVAAGAQAPKSTTPAPKSAAPATTKPAVPAAKTAAKPAAKTAAPAPKAATKAATPAPKTAAHAAPAKSTHTPAKTHAAAKPATPAPVAKPTATTASAEKKAIPEVPRAKRRDPFMNPIRLAEESMRSNPACTTGARCLVISQVTLKGVVKTQSGWIAMVENAAKKEYNLRERDTVQNGIVVKITGDSIVFQETVTDPLGRPMTREVVKRVTAPVV
jgi:Tfp pilus assembly protein PilP